MENNNIISSAKKPRLTYIDLLRGYTMLLVVIGHCWMGDAVGGAMILAFHMPLFFFLSGFLFRHTQAFEKDLVPFVMGKLRQLIIPYFVFELINLVISLLIRPYYGNQVSKSLALQSIILCINDGQYEGIATRLWFFPALFITELLMYFICKFLKYYNKDKNCYYVGAAALFFTGSFGMSIVLSQRLPFSMDISVMAAAYMCLGYASYEVIEKYKNIPGKFLVILGIAAFIVLYLCASHNERYYMYLNEYGNYLLAIPGSLAGIVLMVAFVLLQKSQRHNPIILWFSHNSLLIYPIHLQLVFLMKAIYSKKAPYASIIYFSCCTILTYIIVTVINMIGKYFKLHRYR